MELSHVQRVRLLYKTVLRLHRGLPDELKQLGNIYVREEFKRHKSCNIAEAAAFMNEWTVSWIPSGLWSRYAKPLTTLFFYCPTLTLDSFING
ncbi:unnamed protein product [Timema podura]|uniref:Succinate dehydrogenase assembly factor 3 n=1 Tax=Timema podura TaxID=61482 RepID=A0ABN7P496_TIMPD|nr:unnamed protein product [Timema podura]